MKNEEGPICLLNCYRGRNRTTNAVEGWQNKKNKKIRDRKFKLRGRQFSILVNEGRVEGKRRKTTYTKLDERLEKVIKECQWKDSVLCLKSISYLRKLK